MTAPRRALKLSTLAMTSDTNDFCSSVTSCLKDGSTTCDTTTGGGGCPPCIYVLDNTFTCWEKDNATNTCPFTGVRYDCCTWCVIPPPPFVINKLSLTLDSLIYS